MKKTLFTFFIFSIFIFVFCNNKQIDKTTQKPLTAKDLHVKIQEDYRYVNLIPDSLLTTEDRLLGIKLIKAYMENVEVVDNRLVLKLTREDLKKYNIPEPYFEILQNQLIDQNFFFDHNEDLVPIMLESFTSEKKGAYLEECQHMIDSLQNVIYKK